MKKYITGLLLPVLLLTSCIKDKGNYNYKDLGEIRVEGVPAVMELLYNVDRIIVTPKIVSSTEGEIKADNPNYSFRYRLAIKD